MNDRPLPTIIGPTENTLRALLAQTLSATAIDTYEEWVYLSMTAAGAPVDVVSAALRIPTDRVGMIADELVARGLLRERTALSETGQAELARTKERVSRTTGLLTAGIEPRHLEICGHVLDTVREAAERLLVDAATSPGAPPADHR